MLRGYLIVLAVLLAGCASDAGLSPQAHPVALAQPDGMRLDPQWWKRFQDSQLDSLMDTALRDAPDMVMTEARIRLAQRQAELAVDQLKAAYALDASAVREEFSADGYFPPPIGGSVFNLGTVQLDFTYDLDWWNKHRAVTRAAMGSMAAAQAEADAARLALGVALCRAYFALQADSERQTRLLAMLETQHTQLSLLRERVKVGLASDEAVHPAEGAIAERGREAAVLDEHIRLDRMSIAALAGQPPEFGEHIRVTHLAAPVTLTQPIKADWIGLRPDVAARRADIEVALAQSDLAKIQFYPDITLSGFAGLQSVGFDNLLKSGSEMFAVGPALHLPIFNQGSLRAALGAKYAEYDVTVAGYNQTVNESMRQIAAALAGLQSLSAQTVSQQRVLDSLEMSRQLAAMRYQSGLENELPLLDAQLARQSAQQEQTELALQGLDATLALVQALGGLPESSSGAQP